ncbi:hypothetical protein EKK58_11155 [Candidatus Dependentiae bacterium]|nr:MAG: hypothetical protein EKK58_11155 [Candidatus Dependentiae bacterium]
MKKFLKQFTAYDFKELDKKTQDRVIGKMSDINVDHEWYDFIFEEWTQKLNDHGFTDVKIEFSGFYSQGDGACFTAKHEKGDVYRISHHYSHSRCITSDSEEIRDLARNLSDLIYIDLRKTYDHLTSRESIIETIECNEYLFHSDGRIFSAFEGQDASRLILDIVLSEYPSNFSTDQICKCIDKKSPFVVISEAFEDINKGALKSLIRAGTE